MDEFYWFTRLDSINSMSYIFMIVSGVFICTALLFYIVGKVAKNYDFIDDETKVLIGLTKKGIKICISIFMISMLLNIFVPTTKEAFVIWDVGGSIDYLKSNEKIIQLPDKCIEALDKFIEEYVEEDN